MSKVQHAKVWEGGYGNIKLRTVARDEAEAINNLIEKEPILQAIGCYVTPMDDVDGCQVVAIVPTKFEFGDKRRNRLEKERVEKEKSEQEDTVSEALQDTDANNESDEENSEQEETTPEPEQELEKTPSPEEVNAILE